MMAYGQIDNYELKCSSETLRRDASGWLCVANVHAKTLGKIEH